MCIVYIEYNIGKKKQRTSIIETRAFLLLLFVSESPNGGSRSYWSSGHRRRSASINWMTGSSSTQHRVDRLTNGRKKIPHNTRVGAFVTESTLRSAAKMASPFYLPCVQYTVLAANVSYADKEYSRTKMKG